MIHPERHFTAGDLVRDLVIGASDGLTVPFALAAAIAGAYVAGGPVPLAPYLFFPRAADALPWSVGSTLAALFVFGALRGRAIGQSAWSSTSPATLVGGVAAAAAFAIAVA